MGEPLPEQGRGDVRQDITTSGSASSATMANGVQVNLHIQQGDPQSAAPVVPGQRDSVPIHNLAHRDRGFTGREAQLALLGERLASGGAAVVQAVHGMGGVGKTQLVLEYAHRRLSEYDVVWWVSAEQTGLIGEQFTALGVALGLLDAAADSTIVKSKVLEYLSGRNRWLLIFDNAVRREDVLPWLPRDTGHVLITSRSRNWGQTAQAVELDVLSRAEAVRFLTNHLSGLASDEADQLAEAVGDLPLALAQAVGYLSEEGMPAAEYRQLLVEETQAVLALGQPVNYPQSLAAAITLSVGALLEADPAAVTILRLCAHLAPEPIPVDLIVEVAASVEPHPQEPAGARQAIGKRLARQQAISRLGAYGLAKLGSGTVTVHRLTQAVVRSQLEPSTSAALVAHLESVLGGMRPGDPRDPAYWLAWGRLLPHLLAVDPAGSSAAALRVCARDAVVYLLSRGDAGPARKLAENLYAGWTDRLGADHQDTLRAATELVWALRDLGEFGRLRPLIDDTLTRQIRMLGHDDPDTLRSAADLAVVYSALGNRQRADEIGRDVWARRRRVLGDDHPDTLMTAGNVASSMAALGQHSEALSLQEDVWARRRRVLGDDHPDTLTSASNVASSMAELGRHREALSLQQDVWERRRQVLGDDHPDTLMTAGNVASSMTALGEENEALSLQQDVWERRRRVLGDDHPDTLTTMNNVALAMAALGRYTEALELHRLEWERCRRVLGDDHPGTLTSAGNVASSMAELGRQHEALSLQQDVWERRRRVLGEDYPDTLTSASNVASSMASLGRHKDALVLGQDVWERRRRVLGDDHPDTLLSNLNLAITYFHLRQVLPARRLAEQAWDGLRDKLGADHPHTQRAVQLRSAVAAMMGGRADGGRKRRR